MRIQEFCGLLGLTEHTVRFYEKVGVLGPVARDPSGYRAFTDRDVAWMEFVLKLKSTGMSMEGIRRYAAYRDQGDRTMVDRLRLLEDHERALARALALQQEHRANIQRKIDWYRDQIRGLAFE